MDSGFYVTDEKSEIIVPKEIPEKIQPIKCKLLDVCNSIEKMMSNLKKLKKERKHLLKETNDPIFHNLYHFLDNKDLVHIIMSYEAKKRCYKCYLDVKLDYHYYTGCDGISTQPGTVCKWITKGPICIIKKDNKVTFDYSGMFEIDAEAIKSMEAFKIELDDHFYLCESDESWPVRTCRIKKVAHFVSGTSIIMRGRRSQIYVGYNGGLIDGKWETV